MTQVRAAQIIKRFDNASFIVGSSTVTFAWENPKMYLIPEQLKQLYELGTTYTFTKAQSLGDLETGLLKNTVNQQTKVGTLSKAISGEDYVNTTDIPIGKLVVLDPLYPLSGHKLISPTDFSTRGNEVNEFGYPVANTINVLTGVASKFEKLAITGITAGSLLKVGYNFGELEKAIEGVDYISLKSYEALTIATANTVGSEIIYNGIEPTVDIEETLKEAKKVSTDTRTNLKSSARTGLDIMGGSIGVALAGASTVICAPAAAAVGTAIAAASLFDYIFHPLSDNGRRLVSNSIPIMPEEQKYNYIIGLLMKGGFLNVSGTYKSADSCDDALLSNPFLIDNPESSLQGQLEFLAQGSIEQKVTNRGSGSLWFDSYGKSLQDDFKQSAGGLRLFSWNSSNCRNAQELAPELAPVNIGLFGYNQCNILNNKRYIQYSGFIFELDFKKPVDNPDTPPKTFGLYNVFKSFYTYDKEKSGFDHSNTIFEYDYKNFTFSVPLIADKITSVKEFNIPVYTAGTAPVDSFSPGALWIEIS